MKKISIAGLTLGALGVVYGDIGTSPLYALNEVFFGGGKMLSTPDNIAGVASLIFWIMITIIGIKYATFVLRADNNGEGGSFALLGLLKGFDKSRITFVTFLLMFAAGLLFGEGLITPAISVLSAVEGIKVVTPALTPWVTPITIVILFGIFFFQKNGSSSMGKIYGPVMLIWFAVIGALGLHQVLLYPQIILQTLNPLSAYHLLQSLPIHNIALLLGAVFLVLTGSEALYADLGHFGKKAIRIGLVGIVLPALILNYAGQSAYLMRGGIVHGNNLFYSLAPDSLLIPLVVLATMATIVASVALIFGAYSLVSQAFALSLMPRLLVKHTNQNTRGQIYIPAINWTLCVGSISLVLIFGSATRLAAAYGFTVSGVMVITSIAMMTLSIYAWNWRRIYSIIVFGGFALVDVIFFLANNTKFLDGGFIPFTIGVVIFSVIVTWRWGRIILRSAYDAYVKDRDMQWFLNLKRRLRESNGILKEENRTRHLYEQDRAVVFVLSLPITKTTDPIPVKLRVYLKRKGSIPKNIILLHINQAQVPFLKRRYKVYSLGENVFSVVATFGFMEDPNAASILRDFYRQNIIEKRFRRCSIEVSEDEFIIDDDVPWHIKFRAYYFKKLLGVSVPAYRYFGLYDEAGTGLSKTVVPIRLSKEGARVEIPEFSMIESDDNLDPDTLKETEIQFNKI